MKNDNKLISMKVLPISICLGIWVIAVFFLLCNREREFAITTFLLVTIQLISALTDLHSRTIPLKLMAISLALGLMFLGIFNNKTDSIFNYIFGGITAFAVMILLIVISKGQVGGGDVALMTVTGFFAGINSFFSILFISIILTGVYSLLLVFAKKGSRKTEIPFAPFILFGTVILVLCNVN